jgi:hypothetical protein
MEVMKCAARLEIWRWATNGVQKWKMDMSGFRLVNDVWRESKPVYRI